MKESQYVLQEEAEVEAATNLVTREIRNKKVVEASLLERVVNLSNEANLVRENVGEDAKKVIELAEDVQELAT